MRFWIMEKSNIKVSIFISLTLLVGAGQLLFGTVLADTIEFSDGAEISAPGNEEKFAYAKDFRFTHIIKGAKVYGHNFSAEEIEQLTKDGIKIGKNTRENFLSLEEGNVLFSPDKNAVIDTAYGRIDISGGAVVFVMVSNDGLVIYDLRQGRSKQVSVLIAKNELYIEPGYMLVFSKQKTGDFEKLNLDCHSIAHGKAEELSVPGANTRIFLASFSVSAAFLTVKPLQQLIASSDKQDKVVFDKILRGAAALHDYLGPVQPAQLAHTNRQL